MSGLEKKIENGSFVTQESTDKPAATSCNQLGTSFGVLKICILNHEHIAVFQNMF